VGPPAWKPPVAPHLETFFLSHRYGRPKDQDQLPDRPPIIFVSQFGQPGDYDPLAKREAPVKPRIIAHPLTPGAAPELPRGATSPNRDRDGGPGPGDDDEEELVVVQG
jgi:hypothetical protein